MTVRDLDKKGVPNTWGINELSEILTVHKEMEDVMSGKLMLVMVLSIDIMAIIIALTLGKTPGQYFGEGTFITYLSFLQLLVISGLAWVIFNVRKDGSKSKAWKAPFLIWLIIAIGSVFLSLDEVSGIHENIDRFIHGSFKLHETSFTDRIDDVMVGCYGLFGLMMLYIYREEFKKFRKTFPLLKVGFIFMFTMVALDIVTNRNDILPIFIPDPYVSEKLHSWLDAIEDMLKIIAEGLFIGALYYCFEIARRLHLKPS